MLFFAAILFAGTFYIDSDNGLDASEGTTPGTAWQSLDKVNDMALGPGDTVAFRAGGMWTGSFKCSGSGIENSPIVITSYGEGPRPIVDGGGNVDNVVEIDGQEHIEISNLEITNSSSTEGGRLGIRLHSGGGICRHIYIADCRIHDVMGRYSFGTDGKNTGGIGIRMSNGGQFKDILIEGCEIGNIVRVGISSNGNGRIDSLVVRNCVIHHCAGDGMILRYADNSVIEHNIAYENHDGGDERVSYGVALWCRSTENTVFQYNEVYNTRGSLDAQAFDVDMGGTYNTIFQYNYSHDNNGGFLLTIDGSGDVICRFNIIQDDGIPTGRIFQPVAGNNVIVHNNTIFWGQDNGARLVSNNAGIMKFYNNIFINEGDAELTDGATYENNCYVGFPGSATSRDHNEVTGDPILVAPGSGTVGRGTVDGYMLQAGSSCIGAGIGAAEMGGYWAPGMGEYDYWGNSINPDAIDVGAHQYSGVPLTDVEFLSNSNTGLYGIRIYNGMIYGTLDWTASIPAVLAIYDCRGRIIAEKAWYPNVSGVYEKIFDSGYSPRENAAGVYLLVLIHGKDCLVRNFVKTQK